ncbi:hypothetical protein [Nocardioides sp. AE5]|uniref:hypothetical protein n=1 Tax=Nocardioides sp. AE5 TaxID=2962573 RepID=UPI0028810F78|nr:hypothetical protein [Nocardioides sp. AE5]MDT0201428.1 hypothetical protein [Nocardioides sp. AE5]
MTEERLDPVVRRNTWLYVAFVVTVCLTAVVALLVFKPALEARADQAPLADRTAEDVDEQVYADVLEAATGVTTAFFNIDYNDLDASLERVAAGATGEFAEQIEASDDGLRSAMTENETVIESKVLAAGVVAISDYTARVLVSVSGVVQNTSTGGNQQAREFRIQVDLANVQGEWLVNDLQFVG